MSIKDDFWLWGQVANSHHEEGNNIYNLPGVNKMTPLEGAKFFGIKNMCMVVMEDKPSVEEFPKVADELSSLGSWWEDSSLSELSQAANVVIRATKSNGNMTKSVFFINVSSCGLEMRRCVSCWVYN